MAVETIREDVSGSEDAAAKAFLDRWKGTAEETEEDEELPEGSQEEELEEEAPEGGEEETEEEEAPAPTKAGDDALVVVKVGDQEHEVKVADLKRLYGQEAALTQRSQEAALQRQRADHQAQLAAQKLGAMVQRAQARLEAVSGPHMDVALLARDPSISTETLRALKKEQEEAQRDLEFLQGEQLELHQAVSQETQARHQESAKRAFMAISDPASPVHIPDFKSKYQPLMQYGVSQGIPQTAMLAATDPVLFKLLDKAMAHDQGKTASQKIKVKPKVPTLPKQSQRAGSGDDDGPVMDRSRAMKTLRNTGRVDDAAAAFLAKWKS